jgi:hypothetical protein
MVNETNAVVLFSNPDSRVRRMRYMRYINVLTNSPVGSARIKALRVSVETATTIVRNLRARGFDAAYEIA